MRAIVTGAGGLVGRAMVKRLRGVALTHSDLDITDAAAVRRMMTKLKPEIIVNCAVIGVDACEENPTAAQEINVDGPGLLAEIAEKQQCALLHFSTNYVFDGRERREYSTDDDPNPINQYGRTKLTGECAVFFRCSRAIVVRSSWIFGEGKDSFLSSVHRKLDAGERVRAIGDIFASTTYIEDLAAAVGKIVDRGLFGLHHVVNEGACSYEMFARETARVTGADETLIDVVPSREVQKARRPRYTPMRSSTPLRNWRDALAAYIHATP